MRPSATVASAARPKGAPTIHAELAIPETIPASELRVLDVAMTMRDAEARPTCDGPRRPCADYQNINSFSARIFGFLIHLEVLLERDLRALP